MKYPITLPHARDPRANLLNYFVLVKQPAASFQCSIISKPEINSFIPHYFQNLSSRYQSWFSFLLLWQNWIWKWSGWYGSFKGFQNDLFSLYLNLLVLLRTFSFHVFMADSLQAKESCFTEPGTDCHSKSTTAKLKSLFNNNRLTGCCLYWFDEIPFFNDSMGRINAKWKEWSHNLVWFITKTEIFS